MNKYVNEWINKKQIDESINEWREKRINGQLKRKTIKKLTQKESLLQLF